MVSVITGLWHKAKTKLDLAYGKYEQALDDAKQAANRGTQLANIPRCLAVAEMMKQHAEVTM